MVGVRGRGGEMPNWGEIAKFTISHVLNEQGTGYEYSKSTALINETCHLKGLPKISKFTKFESYWFKR